MPVTLIPVLAELALKYGLPFVQNIIATMKKQNITVDDLDTLFNSVKPYEAYNIPAVAPAAPVA